MKHHFFLFGFFFLLAIPSCDQNEIVLPEEDFNLTIPAALVDFFQKFEEEAEARGVEVDLYDLDITAEFVTIDENNVIGTCSTNGHGLRHIEIDDEFWARAGFYLREMLVFHELGHCALERGHTEETLNNNICASIMSSGTGGCRNAYNAQTREYYLDELFSGR